jgi:hypothetical protein
MGNVIVLLSDLIVVIVDWYILLCVTPFDWHSN